MSGAAHPRELPSWRRWLAAGNFPDHPLRAQLNRSVLTLKGLTYAPTGATVAADRKSVV